MTEIKTNNILTNVAIIRPLLIVLLVFYHAFAIYSGAWKPIEGFPEVKAYWWMDKLSYAFMLETFVFLSGYVFGYQVRTKGEGRLKAKNLFWSKFKRLIIPSMVFSLLYIILFQNITQPLQITLYGIINGVGHMWFLPMLFWCFVGVWAIEKLRLRPAIVIPLLLLSSVFSFVPLPLQMTVSMYYMLFFYAGYLIQRKEIDLLRFYAPKYVAMLAMAFAILFPNLTIFRENVLEVNGGGYLSDNQLIMNVLRLLLMNISKIIYSTIGLSMLFVAVGIADNKRERELPGWLVKIGALCMGVYLFQQFVLKGLYDYTDLPAMLGPYWLPWAGFAIALGLSLLFSYVLRFTKVGRFLIG